MVGRGHRQSDGWHQSIDATAAGQHPLSPGLIPNQTFPWAQLRLHTDLYTKKKGKLTPEDRDARLVTLIQNHAANKDIAMAACGHAMSPQAIRNLLTGALNVEPGSSYGLPSYLQIIVAANHVNPEAVSEIEAQRARALLPLLAVNDVSVAGRYLEAFVAFLMAGVPTHSLLYSHINAVAHSVCMKFAAHLESLQLQSQWLRAQSTASWLSTIWERFLQLSPENLEPEQLLNNAFPSWRTWAAWRPDINRLQLWERFTNEQREALHDLLVLEGPDFGGSGHATLREGLVSQHSSLSYYTIGRGNLRMASDPRDLLCRLLNAIDTACRAGPNDIALLTYLCVGKLVDDEKLQVLENIGCMSDASVSPKVLQVYMARYEVETIEMAAVIRLLPTLEASRCQNLREVLAPYLIERISNCMEEIQVQVRTQMQSSGHWDGTETTLQACGKALQDASWLQPLLDAPLRVLIKDWPTAEDMRTLQNLRIAAQAQRAATPKNAIPLTMKIDEYCMNRLIKQDTINEATFRLVETLIGFWRQNTDPDRRALSMVVAQGGSGIYSAFRCRCLVQLSGLPDDFVQNLRRIIIDVYAQDADTACVDLARLLASTNPPSAIANWRDVLYRMISQRGLSLIDHASTHLTADGWFQWLGDLHTLYGDTIAWHPLSSPAILKPTLQLWAQRIVGYLPVITNLERALGYGPPMQCLLMGCEEPCAESVVQILILLKEKYDEIYQPTIHAIMERLTRDGDNAKEILEALSLVVKMTPDGADASVQVLEIIQLRSTQLAEAMLAGWLQASDLAVSDHRALTAVAKMLDLHIDMHGDPPAGSLEAAADYIDTQVAALLVEAQRLESLRVALKTVNSHDVSMLLVTLEIEDPSPVEDALASLPTNLVDVVEKVSEREVELHFPLTHLTSLQRTAMGAPNAKSLLVRFILGDARIPPGFCMHLDDESKGNATVSGHFPWMILDSNTVPDVPYCHGRSNRVTYQLGRTLSRHLQGGFRSLEDVHTLLTNAIKDLGQSCMTCGTPQRARLHRSTTCQTPECSEMLKRATPDVLLADIRHDPAVVDLLLTMVHAVARSGKFDLLLPGCPIGDANKVLQLLDKLPPVDKLENEEDLTAALKHLGVPTEALDALTWVCNSYHGFLATAKAGSKLRIPNLPGAHQFLLANAAPDIERAFAAHGQGPTKLLFHGTSLDRLHAIMCQGLRICSGSPLQRNGASYGSGIYMAEEPATAFVYSSATTPTSARTGWRNSAFHSVRVLLGCELVGDSTPVSTGIYVINEPSRLMVRYIFLMPQTATAPLAAHVAPAMLSVFSSLRSGAV